MQFAADWLLEIHQHLPPLAKKSWQPAIPSLWVLWELVPRWEQTWRLCGLLAQVSATGERPIRWPYKYFLALDTPCLKQWTTWKEVTRSSVTFLSCKANDGVLALQFLDDWKAKLWSRFFCLSVYVTMYLNDHQRSAFYESIGLDTTQFNRSVQNKMPLSVL